MRWSEAGYLSQIVLMHALRQVSVSLILDVRQKNMKQLPISEFHAALAEYCDATQKTEASQAFELQLAHLCRERLRAQGSEGWDFDVAEEFFSGRGCSILIQNICMPWQDEWDFIKRHCSEVPLGALVNFEVYDSIRDGIQYGGDQILRRTVTAHGVYEENGE
jgi:hypothetical protein